MADMQRAGMTGKASMRIPLSGNVQVGGKIMKELRFMPYSEFPETGREETLYIDTDSNVLYYYDGTAYVALSGGGGGGTGDYNELSNKPQINGNTLTGNKTASNLGLQETISDIGTIRSGAESGSTAVQPATLATALATKQDVISDLASIRTGASKGDTAVQPADMEEALSGKQDTISDLQTIRSGAALGATAVQPADMETALEDKQDVIADLDAIRSGATVGNTALQPEDVDTLPTDGSSNPVSSGGTYNFVNSSIATNTAYFIGTFESVAELEAYTGTVTNNDYAFVTSTDSAGNTLYNRYKYNAAIQTWSFEYAVNNTSFTTAQWAAIQSGMTSADKTKLDGIEQGANKTVIDATPTSGSGNAVSSGGVHTALSGKQDTISDLSDIRSGAAAGATALQQSDVTSTYSASGTAPVNGTAVNAAIGTLNKSSVGGSGKYISAISETNGEISATPMTFDTELSSSSTNNNAPTSKAVYEDQARQETEIGVVANAGAKNLFPYGDLTEITTNFTDKPFSLQAGDYKLSFQISATTGSYAIRVKDASDNSIFYETGSNSATTKTYDMTLSVNAATITFYSSVSNNFTNIMIRYASITDSTFQPYAKTNRELTVAEDEDRAALIEQVDEGAKNKFDPASAWDSKTAYGVTITRNGDTYSIASGTTQSGDNNFINMGYQANTNLIPAGDWVLSFDTPQQNVRFQVCWNGTLKANASFGNNCFFTVPENTTDSWFRILLQGSTNMAGTSFKIMLCPRVFWEISQKFVPYAPTNRELYEMIRALQNA